MKNLIILALIVAAGYYGWQKLTYEEMLYRAEFPESGQCVIVYGTRKCEWTRKYLVNLNEEGVVTVFQDMKRKKVYSDILPRMKDAGIDISHFDLPVIEVGDHIFTRPDFDTALQIYESIR